MDKASTLNLLQAQAGNERSLTNMTKDQKLKLPNLPPEYGKAFDQIVSNLTQLNEIQEHLNTIRNVSKFEKERCQTDAAVAVKAAQENIREPYYVWPNDDFVKSMNNVSVTLLNNVVMDRLLRERRQIFDHLMVSLKEVASLSSDEHVQKEEVNKP